jgi:hypothetical protein
MTGFLYAIGNDERRVKIGWSADPAKRRSEIASDLPGKIELLGVIAATHEQEAEAHQLFEPWRISGEWYRLEGAVAAFVAMLPKPVRPAPDPASLQILNDLHDDLIAAIREHEAHLHSRALGFYQLNWRPTADVYKFRRPNSLVEVRLLRIGCRMTKFRMQLKLRAAGAFGLGAMPEPVADGADGVSCVEPCWRSSTATGLR